MRIFEFLNADVASNDAELEGWLAHSLLYQPYNCDLIVKLHSKQVQQITAPHSATSAIHNAVEPSFAWIQFLSVPPWQIRRQGILSSRLETARRCHGHRNNRWVELPWRNSQEPEHHFLESWAFQIGSNFASSTFDGNPRLNRTYPKVQSEH